MELIALKKQDKMMNKLYKYNGNLMLKSSDINGGFYA
jgi:hypothetical protein